MATAIETEAPTPASSNGRSAAAGQSVEKSSRKKRIVLPIVAVVSP